jgi:anaphase-promoting complex subunit 1
MTDSHKRGTQDPALRFLDDPPQPINEIETQIPVLADRPHPMLAPVLFAFHMLGEDLRLDVGMYQSLNRLASLIILVGRIIRPEWADYWKRLCPSASSGWPSPSTASMSLSLPILKLYS